MDSVKFKKKINKTLKDMDIVYGSANNCLSSGKISNSDYKKVIKKLNTLSSSLKRIKSMDLSNKENLNKAINEAKGTFKLIGDFKTGLSFSVLKTIGVIPILKLLINEIFKVGINLTNSTEIRLHGYDQFCHDNFAKILGLTTIENAAWISGSLAVGMHQDANMANKLKKNFTEEKSYFNY